MFVVGSKWEKELVKQGYRPERLLASSHGVKTKYSTPKVNEATQQQILDFESVDRERREQQDITRQILEECRKVRNSPDWDGEECWIEIADKGGSDPSSKA
jgi:hypothetical protein